MKKIKNNVSLAESLDKKKSSSKIKYRITEQRQKEYDDEMKEYKNNGKTKIQELIR